MSIGARIKKLRKSLGLTQVEFGEKIGIVQGHLTGLERESKKITEKTIIVIYSTFGISEKWLRTGEGVMYEGDGKELLRVAYCFNELDLKYQNLVLNQMEQLLELQR
ncbi:MAG: helix-turn-helix domain-containing protein [Chitinispirillales bacterium]|nr:helix-turn-helix domain-containing protein [Chitinispirillales bacterium]